MTLSSGPAVPFNPKILTIEVTHLAMSSVADEEASDNVLCTVIKFDMIAMTKFEVSYQQIYSNQGWIH